MTKPPESVRETSAARRRSDGAPCTISARNCFWRRDNAVCVMAIQSSPAAVRPAGVSE